jgi:hypothetical protein
MKIFQAFSKLLGAQSDFKLKDFRLRCTMLLVVIASTVKREQLDCGWILVTYKQDKDSLCGRRKASLKAWRSSRKL